MEIQELFDCAKNENGDRFKLKFSNFLHEHPQYANLGQDQKQIIIDLIYKHIDAIRQGRGISQYLVTREMHDLYEKRLALKLTPKDLDDIKEIYGLFEV